VPVPADPRVPLPLQGPVLDVVPGGRRGRVRLRRGPSAVWRSGRGVAGRERVAGSGRGEDPGGGTVTFGDPPRLHSYDDLTTRIWQDKRLTPGTRELLLAIAWILTRDPDYTALPSSERGGYLWRQLAVMLGRDER